MSVCFGRAQAVFPLFGSLHWFQVWFLFECRGFGHSRSMYCLSCECMAECSFTERSCLMSLSVSLVSTWGLFCYLCHVLVSILLLLPSRYLIIESFASAVYLIAFSPFSLPVFSVLGSFVSRIHLFMAVISGCPCPIYVLFSAV